MPDYKKKKHSRILSAPKKPKRNRRVKSDDFDEIKIGSAIFKVLKSSK